MSVSTFRFPNVNSTQLCTLHLTAHAICSRSKAITLTGLNQTLQIQLQSARPAPAEPKRRLAASLRIPKLALNPAVDLTSRRFFSFFCAVQRHRADTPRFPEPVRPLAYFGCVYCTLINLTRGDLRRDQHPPPNASRA